MRRRLAQRWRVLFAVFRVMPAAQVALRVVLLATGGASLVVAQGAWGIPGGLVELVGAVALLGTVAAPESSGAGMVIGAAALTWLLRWGLHESAPMATTLVLAVLLYLFHTTSALLAVLPPGARIAPAVLTRWYSRVAGVLLLGVLFGVVALAVGRVAGGIGVDLLGLVGAVALVAVLVLLARRGRPEHSRPEHD